MKSVKGSRVLVDLKKDLHRKLKSYAAFKGITLNSLIISCVNDYFEKEEFQKELKELCKDFEESFK